MGALDAIFPSLGAFPVNDLAKGVAFVPMVLKRGFTP